MNIRSVSRPALVAALLVPAAGTAAFQNWPDGGTPAQVLYAATKLFTVVFPLFYLLWEKPKRPSFEGLGAGALLGIGISGAICILLASPFGEAVRVAGPAVSGTVAELGFTEHFVLFAIVISVLHTGLEEFYWRGFVFTALTKYTTIPKAHAFAGFGFALHHVAILNEFFPLHHALWLSAAVGVGGVLWSILFRYTGTLFAPWLSHAIVDATLMTIGYHMIT